MTAPILLNITGLTKQYPGVKALDGMSLSVAKGTVHALVGENGAGKSTLIKILAGVLRPDAGEIRLDGNLLSLPTPDAAHRAGISVVHQHTHLIPDLSIGENYALRQGYPRTGLHTINWSKVRREAKAALQLLIPTMDVNRDARHLSGVEKQMVELSFGLASSPRLLILDEPTAVLPHAETELLFERVREYVARGGAALFVSHRLDEIFSLTQDVTVLRDGKLVWTKPTSETDHDDLIRGMVGRSVSFARDPESIPAESVNLTVTGLGDKSAAFHNVSLEVKQGEIYGVYGLVGAGQSELCQALFGLRTTSTGDTSVGGKSLSGMSPGDRVAAGLGYVPADRLSQGMFHQMTVGENMSLSSLSDKTRAGFVSWSKEQDENSVCIRDLRVKTTGPEQNALQLSGGNQQKVLLGRWLQTDPDVLILEEPTQGVDVGAKGEIHKIVTGLARSGKSVLLVTSEIPELLALSHRVGVMREGRLVTELDAANATESELLRHALPDAESKKRNLEASLAGDTPPTSLGARLLHFLSSFREAMLAGILLLMLLILSLTVPAFGTAENFRDILASQSLIIIGALGMMLVIIAGGIDISVGAILGLAAMTAGKLYVAQYPLPVVVGATVAVGLILGTVNGYLTVLGRVHSIVITLGTLFLFRAAAIDLMGGKWIYVPAERAKWCTSPVLILAAGVCAVGVHLLLKHLRAGRRLYAFGGDRPSAAFLGIYDKTVVPLAFGVSGLLVGIVGLLHSSFYGQIQSDTGQGFELKYIAAAVIGGTHIMGGRGSVAGTIIGALFLGVISNALVLTHVSTFWDNVVVGAMILLAVWADAAATRRRGVVEA